MTGARVAVAMAGIVGLGWLMGCSTLNHREALYERYDHYEETKEAREGAEVPPIDRGVTDRSPRGQRSGVVANPRTPRGERSRAYRGVSQSATVHGGGARALPMKSSRRSRYRGGRKAADVVSARERWARLGRHRASGTAEPAEKAGVGRSQARPSHRDKAAERDATQAASGSGLSRARTDARGSGSARRAESKTSPGATALGESSQLEGMSASKALMTRAQLVEATRAATSDTAPTAEAGERSPKWVVVYRLEDKYEQKAYKRLLESNGVEDMMAYGAKGRHNVFVGTYRERERAERRRRNLMRLTGQEPDIVAEGE